MSDWPYDDGPPPLKAPFPSWLCPHGKCTCSEAEDGAAYELSVMLCDTNGKRMRYARCRIWANGRVVNDNMPNADDAGWVTAVVPHEVDYVFIEWAPQHTPLQPLYPYQRVHYVAIPHDQRREAARRRLHNLGFSSLPSLRDNIRQFQYAYGYSRLTGKLEHIEETLARYHDLGTLPVHDRDEEPFAGPIDDEAPAPEQQPRRSLPLLESAASSRQSLNAPLFAHASNSDEAHTPPEPGAKEELPARQPPTHNQIPLGQAPNKPEGRLPTVVELFTDNEISAAYNWVLLETSAKNTKGVVYDAHFWVLDDALKWVVPDSVTPEVAKYSAAIKAYTHVDDPMIPGVRLWRLPCDPVEAQIAVAQLQNHQDSLVGSKAERDGDDAILGSLLLPWKLHKIRWSEADLKVPPQFATPAGELLMDIDQKDPIRSSNLHNAQVNAAAKKKWAGKSVLPRCLADPGKIWAIDNLIDRPNFPRVKLNSGKLECSDVYERTTKAAVNYGFHRRGNPPLQTAARCHGKSHKDYSQLLMAVAGWCEIKPRGSTTWKFRRTASIYTDPELYPLVSFAKLYKTQYDLTRV